jgi:hypothetical protein
MHLITNLTVLELNLTCLREREQQLNKKLEQSTIHPNYLLLDTPLLMAALFFLIHTMYYMSFGVI